MLTALEVAPPDAASSDRHLTVHSVFGSGPVHVVFLFAFHNFRYRDCFYLSEDAQSSLSEAIAAAEAEAETQATAKPAVEPSVRIKCLSGSMLITIKDAPPNHETGLFSGMIYPKGLSKNSTCLSEYR